MISILWKELKDFSRNNWWIYILFIICLFLIWKTKSGNIFEVTIIFFLHFSADLAIMLMQNYFLQKDYRKWLYAQTYSFIIFTIIWIYAGIYFWKWEYLLPQLLFVWPLIQWYFKKIKITWQFLAFFWAFIVALYFYLWLIHNFWNFLQLLWFWIFPTALMMLNDKYKYYFSLLWIGLISLWSAWQLYVSILDHSVSGVDVSYTLLPLSVFIFYLKDIKNYK
jgi:hypothetical protein